MTRSWDDLLRLAEAGQEETPELDFKQSFDPKLTGEWCELLKDLIAMANSGGGAIVIGATDDGNPSLFDVGSLSKLDPATVADKIRSYVGRDFADFRLRDCRRHDRSAYAILVGGARLPFVFLNPGTYEQGGKTKVAFARGSMVFRHGAKSEPATTDDIRESFERELTRVRAAWLENIRKVVEAPEGSQVVVVDKIATAAAGEAVRLTHDPNAPLVRAIDPNETHPYRQKELVARLKKELPQGLTVTAYDIQAVRASHKLDEEPSYVYKPKFGSRQYSEALALWILEQVNKDAGFFGAARTAYAPAPDAPMTAPKSG